MQLPYLFLPTPTIPSPHKPSSPSPSPSPTHLQIGKNMRSSELFLLLCKSICLSFLGHFLLSFLLFSGVVFVAAIGSWGELQASLQRIARGKQTSTVTSQIFGDLLDLACYFCPRSAAHLPSSCFFWNKCFFSVCLFLEVLWLCSKAVLQKFLPSFKLCPYVFSIFRWIDVFLEDTLMKRCYFPFLR